MNIRIYRAILTLLLVFLSNLALAQENFLLVAGIIRSGADSSDSIIRYRDNGAFDRFYMFGQTRPRDMVVGPDGELYVAQFGGIDRLSIHDGSFIEDFIEVGFNPDFTFGPDGNLYFTRFDDSTEGFILLRAEGPNSDNPGIIDPDYSLPLGWDRNIKFGTDLTNDGVQELYLLSLGFPDPDTAGIEVLDGKEVISNGAGIYGKSEPNPARALQFIGANNPSQSYFWSDFSFNAQGSLFVLSGGNNSVERYDMDLVTGLYLSSGPFISPIPIPGGSLSSLTFGPGNADEQGSEDLYVSGGFNASAILRFDGTDGSFVEEFIPGYKVGQLHATSKLLFIQLPDGKNSDVTGLEFDVSPAGGDSYVRTDLDSRRNDNYGRQTFMSVGTGRGGGGKDFGAADAMRSLIFGFRKEDGFGIPKLPISSAILELTVKGFSGLDQTYQIDIHRLTGISTAPFSFLLEGNGVEGGSSISFTADPDAAEGVAWAGAGDNPDPNASNNYTQPGFDETVFASAEIDQNKVAAGDVIRFDITDLVQGWLNGVYPNHGLVLRDITTQGDFRSVSFYTRESPVGAPKLLIGYGKGNLDGDQDIDIDDIKTLLSARNSDASGPSDPYDLDSDGRITVLDARRLVRLCDRPRCANED